MAEVVASTNEAARRRTIAVAVVPSVPKVMSSQPGSNSRSNSSSAGSRSSTSSNSYFIGIALTMGADTFAPLSEYPWRDHPRLSVSRKPLAGSPSQCEACPAPGAATEALADRRASAADVPPRYGCSDPDRLSAEPRSALVDLWLTPEALTVWVLQAAERSGAHVDGAADAPSLLLHVRRTAAVARLLPAGD
jgi:hypothetical protein